MISSRGVCSAGEPDFDSGRFGDSLASELTVSTSIDIGGLGAE